MIDGDAIERQRRYWNAEAESFDAIYGGGTSVIARLLNRVLRRDMLERFDFTLASAQPIRGRTFLDLGCGSGRYSVALAEQGAAHVHALDVSEEMLLLARRRAELRAVQERVSFIRGGIEAFRAEPVDVSIAIGLFDYVQDPAALLASVRRVTKGSLIASFPRADTWRAPVRKLRLTLKGCPVYFFSRRRLRAVLDEARLNPVRWERVGKLHCIVAEPS